MIRLDRRHLAGLSLTVLLFGGAAACGGGTTSSTSPTTAKDASGGTNDAASGGASSNASTQTTKPDVSGLAVDKDFCTAMTSAEKYIGTQNFDPKTLDELVPILTEMKSKAPSDLRTDMAVVADAFATAAPLIKQLTTLQADAQADPAKAATMTSQIADLSKQMEPLSSRAFEDATARLVAYAEEKCGIKPN